MIGAQQAFTSTLGGVVGNVVSMVLVLVAMMVLSWQITLISPGLSYSSPHRIRVTTPTGHHYISQAPDPP